MQFSIENMPVPENPFRMDAGKPVFGLVQTRHSLPEVETQVKEV